MTTEQQAIVEALSKTCLRWGDSIMLYADTGGGKTTLGSELALHVRKVGKLRTRVYSADKGGFDPMVPLVDAGVIDMHLFDGQMDPWTWLNHVTRGEVMQEGKWVQNLEGIGLIIYELGTSLPDVLLMDLSKKTSAGLGTGGEAVFTLTAGEGEKISSNNRTHYNIVQIEMRDKMWQSQRLGVPILWTAAVRRGEDDLNAVIIGPQIAGGAMSASIPRWFKFTFKLDVDPATRAHTLHLDTHKDGVTKAFANSRVPLWGTTEVPAKLTPASLVKALTLIRQRQAEALAFVKKEVEGS